MRAVFILRESISKEFRHGIFIILTIILPAWRDRGLAIHFRVNRDVTYKHLIIRHRILDGMPAHVDIIPTNNDGILILFTIWLHCFRYIQRFMYSDLNFLIFCLLFTIPRPVRTVA